MIVRTVSLVMISDKDIEHRELLDDIPQYCESLVLKCILNVGWAIRLRWVLENLTYHSLRDDLEWWWLADRHDTKLFLQFIQLRLPAKQFSLMTCNEKTGIIPDMEVVFNSKSSKFLGPRQPLSCILFKKTFEADCQEGLTKLSVFAGSRTIASFLTVFLSIAILPFLVIVNH